MILVAVMVVIALGAMVAAAALFRVRAEHAAGVAITDGRHARQAAFAGVDRAIALLEQSADDPLTWQDDPDVFKDQLVTADGRDEWYFTVYAPGGDDPTLPRNGVIDEAGKINLNAADAETLEAMLQQHTDVDVMVDSLLDYIDRDDETRPNGAEQDYYDALPTPFLARNMPQIRTVEELLLVHGFSARVVYGEDHNLNGLLDASEDDRDASFPFGDNGDGMLDRGLLGLATAHSYEYDVDNRGRKRTPVNGTGSLTKAGLPKKTVEFIEALRKDKVKVAHPAELLNMTHRTKITEKRWVGRRRRRRQVTVTEWKTLESGVGAAQLADVLDKLTARDGKGRQRVVGLVNVNTASPEVLACLPEIDEELAARIVDARLNLTPEDAATIAWLYTSGVMDEATFKAVAPRLTARSFQYRIRSVGFGNPCGRYCVLEAVVDFAGKKPTIVYLRDLTRLGLPFAVDAELIQTTGGSY
ncbi:MAG: type II secretion system protein GspK [Phycisphaerae bacterium]